MPRTHTLRNLILRPDNRIDIIKEELSKLKEENKKIIQESKAMRELIETLINKDESDEENCQFDISDQILNRPNSNNDLCSVCLVTKKEYICIPCGHYCCCAECKNQLNNKCPICRRRISSIIKVYP